MTETETSQFQTLEAIIQLLGNDQLQQDLRDEDHYLEVLQKIHMHEHCRVELLNLLTRVESLTENQNDDDKIQSEKQPVIEDNYEKMQLEAFDHISTSFWVALSMSIALFIIGVILMGFAVTEAIHESAISTSTLTIAGLGLADFVLVFFRRPWEQISVNLSHSQQVRTITTSYLAGLALVQRGDTKSLNMLNDLTQRSVGLLGNLAEEGETNRKTASKSTEH